MKKTLRMLCLALVASTSLVGFAQEPQDYTRKVWNYDFEKGPHGWDITAESSDQYFNAWMPQVKGDVKSPGYLGHNNIALEIWQSSGTLKDNSVSQTLTELPNGTYVFGAYMMATNQSNTPNRELIEGVYLFANDEKVSVATNKVEGVDSIWGHSAKFNVAVEVTDGTLKIGAKCVSTNINFTTMDNVTLFYFGDMDKAAALDKMAQIDMQRSLAIADTCVALKSDAESKAYLLEKMEAAKAVTSADETYLADEELLWGMRQVRKSAKSYAELATAIAEAKEYAAKEWNTEYEETQAALDALNAMIAELETGYAEGTIAIDEFDSLIAALNEAKAVLGMDEIYTLIDVYAERVDSISELEGDEIGEYSSDMIAAAEELLFYIDDEMALLSEGVSALEIKTNCEKIFARIQEIIDNPLNYDEFPIFLHRSTELLPGQGSGDNAKAYPVLEGSYVKDYPVGTRPNGQAYAGGNNVITYDSRLFRFREPLVKVRFIVHEAGRPEATDKAGNACFILASFSMYDEHDNKIELTEDNFTSNAEEPLEGQGIAGLIDDNPGSYYHSLWSGSTPQAHYLEVTLPEGEYKAFRFSMSALSCNHSRGFPAEMEITYVSDEITNLQQTIVAARELYPVFGTAPGYYNIDLAPFKTALAKGDAVVEKAGVTDSEIQEAIDNVNAELEKVKASRVMPETGKKYRIISSEKAFVDKQGVQKAMTIHYGDSLRPTWLWWEDACADSLNQEFCFEYIGEDNGKQYYAIKHVATNKYLADWKNADGVKDPSNAVFTLSDTPDSFEFRDLNYGEWAIGREGFSGTYLHMLNHNSGVADSTATPQAGVGVGKGLSSSIITWVNAAFDYSGFYIREMSKLPDVTENYSNLVFQSKSYTLYSNVNIITLTADKACAFDNLVIYDNTGKEQTITSIKVDGAIATIELEAAIASFTFTFDNTEGVEKVVVDGEYVFRGVDPKYTELQTAYNNANNKQVVYGTAVGQVADYKEFEDAMMNAAALLENGGDTEALVAAKAAIDSAVAHLKYNLPVAGKEYFIQSALPWMTRWNSEMDIFTKDDDMAYWGYVNIKDMNHRWKFVDCGQEKNGMPAYYLENVATQLYLTTPRPEGNGNGGRLYVVEDTASAAPFNLHFLTDGKVAIADSREGNANGSWALHPMNHQSGTGYVAYGYMITWGKGDAASAMRIVEAEKLLTDFMTGIEDVEIANEQVAPVQKGIYDLYGRRIMTPAATGIYIVDGKKKVVNK